MYRKTHTRQPLRAVPGVNALLTGAVISTGLSVNHHSRCCRSQTDGVRGVGVQGRHVDMCGCDGRGGGSGGGAWGRSHRSVLQRSHNGIMAPKLKFRFSHANNTTHTAHNYEWLNWDKLLASAADCLACLALWSLEGELLSSVRLFGAGAGRASEASCMRIVRMESDSDSSISKISYTTVERRYISILCFSNPALGVHRCRKLNSIRSKRPQRSQCSFKELPRCGHLISPVITLIVSASHQCQRFYVLVVANGGL